jgi:hypothetical protein
MRGGIPGIQRREAKEKGDEGTGYDARSKLWLHYFSISLRATGLLRPPLFQTHRFHKNSRNVQLKYMREKQGKKT